MLTGALGLACLPRRGHAAADPVVEVDRGVFVRRGLDAQASAANRDGIANTGFIVGARSVLVTDPGGSLPDGALLRAAIRARTDKPISHLVISHAHPDHFLGAQAFLADKPVVVGHHNLRENLTLRGEYYRTRLAEVMPMGQVGTVVYPSLEVTDRAEVDLGDRVVALTAHPTAHSTCDLSMLDRARGILFPADLLFVGRVPALDGSLKGWLAAIDALVATGASRAVPGHGPPIVPTKPAFEALARYLRGLRDETRRAIAAGKPMEAAVRDASQAERPNWALFDDFNGRNVIQAYKELEWE